MKLLNLLFLLFCILCVTNHVLAKTSPFLLDTGANLPPTFLGLTDDRKISQVFINSAGIYQKKKQAIKIENSQSFFGYNYLNFAYTLPLENFTFGLGYQSFSANDIPQTGIAAGGTRPQIINYLLDESTKYDLEAAYAFSPSVFTGMGLHLFTDNLDRSTISQILFTDFGVYVQVTDDLHLGVGYKIPLRALQKALELSNNYANMSSGLSYEILGRVSMVQFGFLAQDVNKIAFSEIAFTNFLSLVCQNTWDKYWNNNSFSMGGILTFDWFSLEYLYVIISKEGLEVPQNILSAKFEF